MNQVEPCGEEVFAGRFADQGDRARIVVVSPLLTLYRLCSFLLFRDLEPERRSCQVKGVPDDWDKTAQADAGHIDKGLTLIPSVKGIGL